MPDLVKSHQKKGRRLQDQTEGRTKHTKVRKETPFAGRKPGDAVSGAVPKLLEYKQD
jgi:hypothetical protein